MAAFHEPNTGNSRITFFSNLLSIKLRNPSPDHMVSGFITTVTVKQPARDIWLKHPPFPKGCGKACTAVFPGLRTR